MVNSLLRPLALLLISGVGLVGCAGSAPSTSDAGSPFAERTSTGPSSSPGASPAPGTSAGPQDSPSAAAPSSPPPALTLPRGGRQIFPTYQVIMAYGTAGTGSLGVLGEVPPEEAARRLLAGAIPYIEASGRPVHPAFELITTVAQRFPGKNGAYSNAIPDSEVQRYLEAARKAKMLLVLDFQPGREDFLTQVKRYEKFLLEPEVGIALDPEWVLKGDQKPGRQVGTTTAKAINDVSSYVANLTVKNNLPEKLFIVHQFQTRMIPDREKVVDRPGLATVFHVDGFGNQNIKKETYGVLADTQGEARPGGLVHNGFKLFLDEDTNLMTPAEAMALVPRPELISYQ